MDDPKVCIVGAGPCGLTAAKTLHERGIPFECFEKGSQLGGLWRYENDNAQAAAYRSLHLNSSKDRTGFFDYPMPTSYPDFPHHSLVLKYLEDYTHHFGFGEKITFQTTVSRIEPLESSSYEVTTQDRAGKQQRRVYSAVIVANGHHWKPRWPQLPGAFSKQMLHSHDYRTPEPFAGKRVLVVGMGNSACDIACDIARVAESVQLSIRRGAHIIPKYILGKPLDKAAPRWMWRYLPFPLFQRLFALALHVSRGRLKNFGLPTPSHRILEEHPTISSDLLPLIGHGKIGLRPLLQELAGEEVVFEGGGRSEVDAILFATGYQIAFPFLDPQVLNPQGNEVSLYKRVVHPDYPGLYFLGLIQPWGSVLPLAEEQGKWVADLLEQKCGLPSRSAMQAEIQAWRQQMQRRYTQSCRHTIQVDFYPYLDDLRRERRRRPTKQATVTPERRLKVAG